MTRVATAAVFHGAGHPLELRAIPVPEVQGSEVLVRVTCCTLCGSDLHTYAGRRQVPLPTVLGHEIVGRIEAFGPSAVRRDWSGQPLVEGDRVTWSVAASCGGCFYCAHDLPQKCERLLKYGHEAMRPGHELHGGLADCCLLAPGTALFRLPDELSDAVACPANCAVATVAAVLRAAGGCRQETVLVQGAGMLGLTACAMAREGGASAVICSEPDPQRRARAEGFGATHLVGATLSEVRGTVNAATEERGVDLALELTGSSVALEMALPLLRTGGRYVLAGFVRPSAPVVIDPEAVVRRLLTLRGVHNYAPCDLREALRFLVAARGRFAFDSLVVGSFALRDVERAFQKALTGAAPRVAVIPETRDKFS